LTALDTLDPGGFIGLADFSYLADHASQPFAREWPRNKAIRQHDKFVVADFSLPAAFLALISCVLISMKGGESWRCRMDLPKRRSPVILP
jgi:hypothetical protein